jgi:hypothetical protein
MGQRSTRRGKPHCEAFPALDILQAERSLRAGSGICEWRNERGVLVGRAQLVSLDQGHAVVSYEFDGSANIETAKDLIRFDIVCTRRNPHVVRKSLFCQQCGGLAQKIYFVSATWKCRSCHNLVYLKQRLGFVNKAIRNRDKVIADLQKVPVDSHRTRWFYNQQRHLDRLNRELAAGGFETLPQELLYRTYQQWIAPGDHEIGNALQASPHFGQFKVDQGGEDAAGLAFFQPPPAPWQPVEPCELIGSAILGRPFGPFLTRHKADHADQLRRDLWGEAGCPAGPMSIHLKRTAGLLAERILLRPIVITSAWTDMVEVGETDGRTEYATKAAYEGDPTLWPLGSCARPYKRVLRAILDEDVIELRVRLPRVGRSDPIADLETARAELLHRLDRVTAEFEAFNAMRDQLALRWVYNRWRR